MLLVLPPLHDQREELVVGHEALLGRGEKEGDSILFAYRVKRAIGGLSVGWGPEVSLRLVVSPSLPPFNSPFVDYEKIISLFVEK